MAVIKAVRTSSIVSGYTNEHLSDNLLTFSDNWHPYPNSAINLSKAALLKRNTIVLDSLKIKGVMPKGYIQDVLYNRMHITPLEVDLGNVVTSQTFTVYVWNAYFTKQNLISITGLKDGLTLNGIQAPYVLTPLQELKYEVSVSADGAVNIDDYISWHFDNGQMVSVHITGARIVLFPIMPNWQQGITESLEWSTDILTSQSGFEQRSALYLTPRRTFEAEFIIYQQQRQYFNNMMSWGARNWAIPLWPYIQMLSTEVKQGDTTINCTTQDIEFTEGGLVLLYCDFLTYEIAEIITINSDSLVVKRPIQANWSEGTRVYPAKSAYFTKEPSLTRKTDNLQTSSIAFFIDDNNPFKAIAPTDNYQGYPVFMLRPDESEDLSSQYQRLLETVDNKMALPLVFDKSGYSFLVQGYRWLGMGRKEHTQFRALIYFLNGRQKALWIPSHADDLTVIDTVSATEPVLVISACGYTRYALNDPDKRHIVIYLADGSYYFRQIVDSEAIDGKERLALDSALGKQLQPNEFSRICFMRLCRSNSDAVEIKHINDTQGVASSQLTFKRVRDNEL